MDAVVSAITCHSSTRTRNKRRLRQYSTYQVDRDLCVVGRPLGFGRRLSRREEDPESVFDSRSCCHPSFFCRPGFVDSQFCADAS